MLLWLAETIGLSSLLTFVRSNPIVWDSAKLVILGVIFRTGQTLLYWAIERFRLRWFISAEFNSSNQAHEWIVSFLTKQGVWKQSRDFLVESATSQRKCSIASTDSEQGHVRYVPGYHSVHFFRWRGYWLEVRKGKESVTWVSESGRDSSGYRSTYPLYLTLYTFDMSVLFAFVEECRLEFIENSKPSVTVYSSDSSNGYGGAPTRFWNNAKTKYRRPLESVVLEPGVIESLLSDAREFFNKEDWYMKAGIPHRRGYLLYGPPGTGKTSTVYATASELGVDIYTLSLASSKMDDDSLVEAVSLLPPRGILLIEDIDCAFPSREDEDEIKLALSGQRESQKSAVTLSGLLNVLDGVGSEEGKIFFATTNHIDRLDPALLRPGRIDRKIQYKLASKEQAKALFNRFFPPDIRSEDESSEKSKAANANAGTDSLAEEFSNNIPIHEFSTAELQGYLLEWKSDPRGAADGVQQWVEQERSARQAREERERIRKEKIAEAKAKEQMKANEAMIVGIGNAIAQGRKSRPKHRGGRSLSSSEQSGREDSDRDPSAENQQTTESVVVVNEDGHASTESSF